MQDADSPPLKHMFNALRTMGILDAANFNSRIIALATY